MGFEKAAKMYQQVAEENLKVLRPLVDHEIGITIVYDPPEAVERVKRWLGDSPYDYLPQRGEGLTERLANTFQFAFGCGTQKVLAMGSDTLGVRLDIIKEAYHALEKHDVVLGPAEDGGYYLIGLSCFYSFLFENIPWSTSKVLEETIVRARRAGLSCYLLPLLRDLDEGEDSNIFFTNAGKNIR